MSTPSTEARDALAAAREEAIIAAFSKFRGDLRLARKDVLARAFLEVLDDDGWVLARRQDAEDGADWEGLANEWRDQAQSIEDATHTSAGKQLPLIRRRIAADVLRGCADEVDTLFAAARKAREALR